MNNIETVFVMNYHYEKLGEITYDRETKQFQITYEGEETRYTRQTPKILSDILPEPSQFVSDPSLLALYDLAQYDFWELLKKHNGIKNTRDIWFMAKPEYGVLLTIPLVMGMQKTIRHVERYHMSFREGDDFRILMSGDIEINRHRLDVLPKALIVPFLVRAGNGRYSTSTGKVISICKVETIKRLVGKIEVRLNLENTPTPDK